MGMNQECLENNLLSFDMQRDDVPGNGNSCFTSIAKVVNKFASNGENVNVELIKHLTSLGLCKSVEGDTICLRQLFCEEMKENKEKYQGWVDFNITDETEKFSQSGWFNCSLGDLCVLACSNIMKMAIVVIMSIGSIPYIPFIPSEVLTDGAVYIAYNHSGPGHYDATKGIFFVIPSW